MNGRHRTAALLAGYVASLGVVYVLDDPLLWIGWAVVAIVASGVALVQANR